MNRNLKSLLSALALPMLAALPAPQAAHGQATEFPIAELGLHTHVHGLAVDRANGNALLVATHHGLFRVGADGVARSVSVIQDYMGFSAHPRDPLYFYASGHPAEGGNLGIIVSGDGGKTWQTLAYGDDGPVDFHQMTISPADPKTLYGAYKTLQVSRDGGKKWESAGPRPQKLIDLAASAVSADIVYAATEAGLSASRDGGKTFAPVLEGAPVTLVEAGPSGDLFVFEIGKGLRVAREEKLEFETLNGDWGDAYLLHLAIDPASPQRMFASTGSSIPLESGDGGRTWAVIGQ